MLKIVIIEDEKLTANDLVGTLKSVDNDIEIVAILASIQQAIAFFKTSPKIDLIFSDIQLPDGLSFEIFTTVQPPAPLIFCTAFDQYALEAFNTNGIDYILKPFSKATVAKALDKYQSLKEKFTTPNNDYNRMLQHLGMQVTSRSLSIMVNHGDKIIPLGIQSIALFYLENDYTFALTFEMKRHIVEHNLEELENLCGQLFFRANRQYLINRKAVKDVSRYLNRKLLVNINISYSEQIIVGKLKTKQLLDWLANS